MSEESIHIDGRDYDHLNEIIALISGKKDAEPFKAPVDYEGLGLHDYPLIVKRMMDLGTLHENLKKGRYKTVRECLDDLQLVWDNCKLYNVEFSKIYKIAQKLEVYARKLVEDRFGKVEYGKSNTSHQALIEQSKNSHPVDE